MILFGQIRTGFRTSKPKRPRIHEDQVVLPLVWLWGPYTVIDQSKFRYSIRHDMPPEYYAEHGYIGASHGGWIAHSVRPPGNMLRDLIRYWHVYAKKRKLADFCAKHGLDVPQWPTG